MQVFIKRSFEKIQNQIFAFPHIVFLFLLFVLLIQVLFFHQSSVNDEYGYLELANNLIHGFYSYQVPEKVNIWWGPGYPLFLAIFLKLGISVEIARIFNALFIYGSILLFYQIFKLFFPLRKAIIITIVYAVYSVILAINVFKIGNLLTEPFIYFLNSLLIFTIIQYTSGYKKRYLVISGLIFGYLALTKVLFGYVILLTILVLLFFSLYNKKYRPLLYISLLALLVNIPYLWYTYRLTGKYLYWSNSGGMSLYWMSTPYKGELGEWYSSDSLLIHKNNQKHKLDNIIHNHIDELEKIHSLKSKIEIDSAYKKIAIENIKSNPLKYAKNIVCNIGRLFFDFPRTGIHFFKTGLNSENESIKSWIIIKRLAKYFIIRLPLFIITFFTLIFLVKKRKYLSNIIIFLSTIYFIYFGLSSLVSGSSRMLVCIFPLVFFIFLYLLLNKNNTLIDAQLR